MIFEVDKENVPCKAPDLGGFYKPTNYFLWGSRYGAVYHEVKHSKWGFSFFEKDGSVISSGEPYDDINHAIDAMDRAMKAWQKGEE